MKNGTADLLAKALRDEELQKGTIKSEFRDKFGTVTSKPGYHSASEPYLNANAAGCRIILLDVYTETELEKALIDRLASETELLSLSLSPDNPSEKYELIRAFSPREEVLACAKHIKAHCREDQAIMIAVASMEKYAPHLQRQFPKLGLRTRFIGPRSLYEFPCTTLLMNYLKLCAKGNPDWSDLATIRLNALMDPKDHLFDHDKAIRQDPVKEIPAPLGDLYLCNKSSDLLDYVTKFAKDLKKDNDSDTCKACDKFTDILETVIRDLDMIDQHTDIAAIYREMSERIKKESIPRRDQWNGIPVVGLLDSLGVQSDKLYVLGMVEGDIPRQEGDNPFFNKNLDYTLELNKHFMYEWRKLGDKVVFCTSRHAEDGTEQNMSSFLEDMTLDVVEESVISRRDELLQYAGHMIGGFDDDLAARHNEILSGEKGTFSGNIDVEQHQFNVSVTQVDKLLACPMKFYFETVMKCYSLDKDEQLFWGGKRGDVIHKAFEVFIKENGYGLELEAALDLMKTSLEKAFEHEKIDIGDPLIADRFRQYLKDMEPGSEKNCLAINLALIKDKYSDYKKIESEIAFEKLKLQHPNLDIWLNGRIDKIMIDEEENKLIASDFKTGSITTSLLSKMMLSQLYLYLKYCEKLYPEHELKAMYEKLKNTNECGMTEYMEVAGEFKQLGRNAKQSFVTKAFEDYLRELFSQIAAGKYYITEKDFDSACKYCDHESLCRKNTRLKN
jgi:RecB family exonuclease